MNTDLAALRELVELAEKATPGPWHYERCTVYLRIRADNGDFILEHYPDQYKLRHPDDCRFIVAVRNAMPALGRLLEAGVPEGYALVPKDQKLIPYEAWENAAIAFRLANGPHGFYESCYAAFHAFLRSIGQEKPIDNPVGQGVVNHPPSEGEQHG
jgi:hypothetical protein